MARLKANLTLEESLNSSMVLFILTLTLLRVEELPPLNSSMVLFISSLH